jgi:hypothetical protein
MMALSSPIFQNCAAQMRVAHDARNTDAIGISCNAMFVALVTTGSREAANQPKPVKENRHADVARVAVGHAFWRPTGLSQECAYERQ